MAVITYFKVPFPIYSIKDNEVGRHVARVAQGRKVYRSLVGKPKGKRPLERPRRRWEDRIRMDLREIGWGLWRGFTLLRIGTGGGLSSLR
jgi:hypothetical protein